MSFTRFLAFGLALALLGAAPNYAPTPQEAAQLVFSGPGVTLTGRPNVAGKFAIVPVTQGVMEGSSDAGRLILLKRFSFGWQALALVDNTCASNREGVPSRDLAALFAGLPKPSAADCVSYFTYGDHGPTADVESVRKIMGHAFLPGVTVVGNYAVGDWYGGGGGQNVYHRASGAWTKIGGGGGALSQTDLTHMGIPAGDACKFPVMGCMRH